MEWNGMGWDGMEWGGVGYRDGMEWGWNIIRMYKLIQSRALL